MNAETSMARPFATRVALLLIVAAIAALILAIAAVVDTSARASQTGRLMAQVEDYRAQLADAVQRQNAFASQADECKAQLSDAFLRAGTSDAEAHTLREKVAQSQAKVDALQTQVADLHVEVDLAKKAVTPEPLYSSYSMFADFQAKGLTDPAKDIVDDLMKHHELIPFEGFQGAKMYFHRDGIRIVNGMWVTAYFEDGHYSGEMILEYKVLDGGKIVWKVLAANM